MMPDFLGDSPLEAMLLILPIMGAYFPAFVKVSIATEKKFPLEGMAPIDPFRPSKGMT